MAKTIFRKAFTLIEIFLVLFLLFFLIAAAAPFYLNFQTSAQLNESASQMAQILRLARERSRSGLNDTGHGVYLKIDPAGQDSYVLYQGLSYSQRNSGFDQEFFLERSLGLSSDLDDNQINFTQAAGTASQSGHIFIIHENGQEISVEISPLGLIRQSQ